MYLSFVSVDGGWRIRCSGIFYTLGRQTFDEQQAVTQQVKYQMVRYNMGFENGERVVVEYIIYGEWLSDRDCIVF